MLPPSLKIMITRPEIIKPNSSICISMYSELRMKINAFLFLNSNGYCKRTFHYHYIDILLNIIELNIEPFKLIKHLVGITWVLYVVQLSASLYIPLSIGTRYIPSHASGQLDSISLLLYYCHQLQQ